MYVQKVELEDRSARLFGRGADIALLSERARRPGVTAVVGQPQMGKSWLLMETARRLAEEGWAGEAELGKGLNLEARPMVGFVNEAGADMLSRGMRDLYLRWLEDADLYERAKGAWSRNENGVVGRAGAAFGTLAKAVFAFQGPHGAVIGGAVKELFDGLEKAAQGERQVGQQFARLPLDDARHLLWIMHEVTGRSAALFLDQWEDSPKVEEEARTLRTILRAIKDSDRWPPCHIVVGLRDENRVAVKAVDKLCDEFGDLCFGHRLAVMDLGGGEAERLLARLRTVVPATREAADEDLLEMMGGYPCVPNRWMDRVNARAMAGPSDLKQVADDAHHFRYPEFERELDGLTDDERRVAIRLALLPGASGAVGWAALKPIALRGVSPGSLDKLLAKGYFQSVRPPSYGHAKRAEAAVVCLKERCFSAMGAEVEELVPELAKRVQISARTAGPIEEGLASMKTTLQELGASNIALALCEAARTLFGRKADLALFECLELSDVSEKSCPLLASGLVNAMNYADKEAKPKRRDELFVQLETLVAQHSEDAAVREALAKGLYNATIYAEKEAKSKRRDGLLVQLETLAAEHSTDAAVREQLSKVLVNAMIYAEKEAKLQRRDELLVQLQTLAEEHSRNETIRGQLATGLVNAMIYAETEAKLQRRDELFFQLQALAEEHTQDAVTREQFAKGLITAMIYAEKEAMLQRSGELLVRLRTLAAQHRHDAAVREWLAKGLVIALNYADREAKPERRDALLVQLQALVVEFPEDEFLLRVIVPLLEA